MDNLIQTILPYLITGLSAIGTFEGIVKFVNSKQAQKYTNASSKILRILDNLLIENPSYKKYEIDHIIDVLIDVTNDGKFTFKDYYPIKEYVIKQFDVREHQSKKETKNQSSLSRDDQKIKSKVREKLKND